MKKIKVAVLAGGPSSEHEVSLKSAENVIKYLDENKFEVLHIKISKEGVWIRQDTGEEFSEESGLEHLKNENIDLIFIILHGEYGEDGSIQRKLESCDFKFTGSDSESSTLAMDKFASSKTLDAAGLKTANSVLINSITQIQGAELEFPQVVKPNDRGSSVGISIVKNFEELENAIKVAKSFSDDVMIQEFIKGREMTCAVIETANGEIALMPTEIMPTKEHDFFDYQAKYVAGASIEITPPNLPKEVIENIQEAAIAAHKALGCRHISRSDFILAEDKLYILEVNTIPGMTGTSLVPQGAKALGIEFPQLLEIIIEAALK